MPRADLQRVEITSRAAWRTWLTKHHTQKESIWLVTYKKTSGGPYVPHDDIVEEVLCFGWIDGQRQRLDEERTMLLCAPRRTGSPWSAPNKKRITKLRRAGLLHPAGLAVINAAKKDGSWTLLDDVEKMINPPDLDAALRKNRAAAKHFAGFPAAAKKGILWWIKSARKPETRAKRIADTVAKAAKGEPAR